MVSYGLILVPLSISFLLSIMGGAYFPILLLMFAWSLVFPFFVSNAYLRVSRGEEYNFKSFVEDELKENGARYAFGSFIQQVLIVAWSFLFVIPGIIKSLSYAMTPFILHDNPDIKPLDAISESRRLMKDQKWEFVKLLSSYIIFPVILSGLSVIFATLGLINGIFGGGTVAFFLIAAGIVCSTLADLWTIFMLPKLFIAQAIFYDNVSNRK